MAFAYVVPNVSAEISEFVSLIRYLLTTSVPMQEQEPKTLLAAAATKAGITLRAVEQRMVFAGVYGRAADGSVMPLPDVLKLVTTDLVNAAAEVKDQGSMMSRIVPHTG